jgi:zinc D-Ala-D-Ala carboxypeptidase
MQLSPNFHLSELIASQSATRWGINNTPDEPVKQSLTALAIHVLQPVRDHFDKPVIVSSGYRSPQLNRIIGGSRTSQHMTGHAADFEIPSIPNLTVAEWIRDNLSFDQLILEFYTGGNTGWIHCSYISNRNRKQILTINGNGTLQGFRVR